MVHADDDVAPTILTPADDLLVTVTLQLYNFSSPRSLCSSAPTITKVQKGGNAASSPSKLKHPPLLKVGKPAV